MHPLLHELSEADQTEQERMILLKNLARMEREHLLDPTEETYLEEIRRRIFGAIKGIPGRTTI